MRPYTHLLCRLLARLNSLAGAVPDAEMVTRGQDLLRFISLVPVLQKGA